MCIILEYLCLLVSSASVSSCVRVFASCCVWQYLVVRLSIAATGHTVPLGQHACDIGITGAIRVMEIAVAWHPRARLKLIMVMQRGTECYDTAHGT